MATDFATVFPGLVVGRSLTKGGELAGEFLAKGSEALRKLTMKAAENGITFDGKRLTEFLDGKADDQFKAVWDGLTSDHKLVLIQSKLHNDQFLQSMRMDPTVNQLGAKAGGKKIVEQGFRTDKFLIPEESQQGLKNIQSALGLDTREVRSWDEVRQMAAQLGRNPDDFMARIRDKKLLSDAEVQGLKNTIRESSQFLAKKYELIEANPSQEADILRSAELHEKLLNEATEKYIGAGTELGRAVNMYRATAESTMDPAYWFKEAVKVRNGKPLDAETITAINSLIEHGDKLGLAHFLGKIKESPMSDKAITLWKAGLLTNPKTHLANILGNTTMQALETAKNIPATIIDVLMSPVTGKRTKTLFDGKQGKAYAGGLAEGFKKGIDYVRTGIDASRSSGAKWDSRHNVHFNNAIAEGYTQTVFRLLGAEDMPFYFGSFRRSMAEQAALRVKNMKGTELSEALSDLSETIGKKADRSDLVEFFTRNPSDEMTTAAINDAEKATFRSQNILTAIANGAKQGASTNAFAKILVETVAPFTSTPANVATAIADYSPVGILTTLAKQLKGFDQKALVEGLGRGIIGTSAIAIGAALYDQGLMSGARSRSTKDNNLNAAAGIPQYSVLVNGEWRQLNRISPLGNLLAIGAEFGRLKEDKTGLDLYSSTTASGMKQLTQQSFLFGLSSALNAVTDPEQYASSYVTNAATGLIPSIIAAVALGSDKYVRDPDLKDPWALVRALQGRTPILSQKLAVKTDIFGRNVKNQQGVLGRMLDPFTSQKPMIPPRSRN